MAARMAKGSVKTRITLRVGIAVGALILALILVVGVSLLRAKYRETVRDGKSLVATLAQQVSAINQESLTLARSLTVYQTSVGFGRRAETLRYLYDLKVANPAFFGTWTLYAANADGQDARWKGKPGADPRTGRFLPYWNPSPEGLKLGVATDAETLAYGMWPALERSRTCHVTEPYFYNNELQSSYGCAIVVDGQFKGIAGVDRRLSDFDRRLRASTRFRSAMFLILSPQGRYVAAPEQRLLTRSLSEFPDQARVFGDLVGSTEPRFRGMVNPFNHRQSWLFSVPIRPGAWTLAMMVDRSEILAPVYRLLQWLAGIGLVGVGLVLLLLYSLIGSAIRPIERLARAGKAIAEGDVETVQGLFPLSERVSGEDEFARMTRAFQEASRYLVAMSDAFERIAQGDLEASIVPRSDRDRFGQALTRYVRTISSTIQELETKRHELFIANQEMEATVENLRRLDQLRASFLNVISHDLRIPITAIVGYAELLQEGTSSPEEAMRFLRQILAACEQMQTMLEELLEYARLQTGQVRLDLRPVDATEVLGAVVALFRPLAEQKGLCLCEEIPDDLPWVLVDPDRFQQILNNLLSNAIKYTSPGGRVTVRARAVGEDVAFEVEDTGFGLTQADRDHLFEQFYRSERPAVRREKGSGIGLSYVKGIVEAHHGRIEVDSKEGVGSTFRVYFPQAPGELA